MMFFKSYFIICFINDFISSLMENDNNKCKKKKDDIEERDEINVREKKMTTT
jgi:hypothetical protein